MSFVDDALHAIAIGYICNEIERETLEFAIEWANSDWPKDRRGLLDYMYELLDHDVIYPEQYVAVKELI